MKKLLFGLIATVMFGFVGSAQVKSDTKSQESKIHIEFGRKSKDCGGFGICVFTIDLTIEDLINIIGVLKTSDNGVKVNFTKEFYLQNEAMLKSGYLTLEEDFTIDEKTSLGLGFRESKILKAGRYPLKFDSSSNTYNCYMN